MAAEILVRGESEVRCLPDRAVVRVLVEEDGESQTDAFNKASLVIASIDAVLDTYTAAIERRLTVGVMLRPKTYWQDGEPRQTGWTATRNTLLEIVDFARLGLLVSEVSAAGASTVQGPTWEVDIANPAHAQARREATLDARRRALAYADALGVRLGMLKWFSEPGVRHGTPVPHVVRQPAFTAFQGARRAPGPIEPVEIRADEMEIHATVEACFEALDDTELSTLG